MWYLILNNLYKYSETWYRVKFSSPAKHFSEQVLCNEISELNSKKEREIVPGVENDRGKQIEEEQVLTETEQMRLFTLTQHQNYYP